MAVMKRSRNLIAALALSASALFVALPSAAPVEAAGMCGTYIQYSYIPHSSTVCTDVGLRYYRSIATCSPGNPVNQYKVYGPWQRSGVASRAYCTNGVILSGTSELKPR